MSSTNYSHDNSSEDSKLSRRDDDSLYSTSSVFSTSSRLSKIPNAVKSSFRNIREMRLKQIVKRRMTISKIQSIPERQRLNNKKASMLLHNLAHKEYPKQMPGLYSCLIHDCDDILNAEHNQEIPRRVLLTVISGIREMIKMTQEESIERDLEQIEKRIQVDNVYKAVYDTIHIN